MKPPEIHSELTSHGDNGLLPLRPGSSGSLCQDGEPLLHRVISGLETHHAPCQFNQSGPQPAISMLCDRTGAGKGPYLLEVWKPTRKHLMSKAELVAAVQKALGKEASSAQAERTVDAVIEGIKTGVKKTKSVQLVGFGTFKIATRKARTGVNPKTGAKIKIKATKTVKFVPGKAFKELL